MFESLAIEGIDDWRLRAVGQRMLKLAIDDL
jgi:hypothetical protein